MKLTYISVLLALMLTLFACGSKDSAPPLSKEKLKMVLVDVYLVEGARALNLQAISRDTARASAMLAKVFKHHEVNQTEFLETYRYYTAKHDEMEALLDGVMEELSRMETKEEARRRGQPDNTQDSTKSPPQPAVKQNSLPGF